MEIEAENHISPVEEWEEWEYEQSGPDGDIYWNCLPELMEAHQLQPDREGWTQNNIQGRAEAPQKVP